MGLAWKIWFVTTEGEDVCDEQAVHDYEEAERYAIAFNRAQRNTYCYLMPAEEE